MFMVRLKIVNLPYEWRGEKFKYSKKEKKEIETQNKVVGLLNITIIKEKNSQERRTLRLGKN